MVLDISKTFACNNVDGSRCYWFAMYLFFCNEHFIGAQVSDNQRSFSDCRPTGYSVYFRILVITLNFHDHAQNVIFPAFDYMFGVLGLKGAMFMVSLVICQ